MSALREMVGQVQAAARSTARGPMGPGLRLYDVSRKAAQGCHPAGPSDQAPRVPTYSA